MVNTPTKAREQDSQPNSNHIHEVEQTDLSTLYILATNVAGQQPEAKEIDMEIVRPSNIVAWGYANVKIHDIRGHEHEFLFNKSGLQFFKSQLK
ncbi:hypothetical protein G7Z17_g1495 [Cylindrodendrum hubeiense]|uniref:Uncharacterized protein n=1 Tax=Cylindrodendrum hubeiense TaxID=595255 RepID=A0A9P5LFB3_9HYPO|nr:hypothetical protein G7Z17_g1495 [Cylindrodendrum hubeiense]